MLKRDALYWINKLHLKKHPEGGYFVETYRSKKLVDVPEYDGPRHACTAIYYLVTGEQFASFHKMKSDELWHFYAGSSLNLYIIETGSGKLRQVTLGSNIDNGESFQVVVNSGSWFAASVDGHDSYSLVGCTVSPGFDYRDWELADRETLVEKYPGHKLIIEKYASRIKPS